MMRMLVCADAHAVADVLRDNHPDWEVELSNLEFCSVDVTVPCVVVASGSSMTTDALLRLRRTASAPFAVLPHQLLREVAHKLGRGGHAQRSLVYDANHNLGYQLQSSGWESSTLQEVADAFIKNDVDRLYVNCHGEGSHLKLTGITVCGLRGDIDRTFEGRPIVGGCQVGRCRRDPSGSVLRVAGLRANHLIADTCNGLAFAEQGFPSASGIAWGALEGRSTTLVTSSCCPIPVSAICTLLFGRTMMLLKWWEIEALLNQVAHRLLGFSPYVTVGIPNILPSVGEPAAELFVECQHFVSRALRERERHRSTRRREALRAIRRSMSRQRTTLVAHLRGDRAAGGGRKIADIERELESLLGNATHHATHFRCLRCASRLHAYTNKASLQGFSRIQQLSCPVCGVLMTGLLRAPAEIPAMARASTRFKDGVLTRRLRAKHGSALSQLSQKAGGSAEWREKRSNQRARVRPHWPAGSPSEIDTLRTMTMSKTMVIVDRIRAVHLRNG